MADQLREFKLRPLTPDTRFEIEDQDGQLLAYAAVHPWTGEPEFALYRPAGDLMITWPPTGGQVGGTDAPPR